MYLGNQPALSYTSFAKQDFTTSATTNYVLDHSVANANELALFINFVRQEPTTAYTASGTTLTLTSATSASDDMYCIFLGKALQTVNPPAGSVGASQITDGSITSAKLASGVGGKVLQVVYAEDTGIVSSTTTTYVDTGLSGTITPSSTSSKILIHITLADAQKVSTDTYLRCRALRNGSEIFTFVGQAGYTGSTASNNVGSLTAHYLDSPASTTALVYKTQFHNAGNSGTVYLQPDGNGRSTMILMEIAG